MHKEKIINAITGEESFKDFTNEQILEMKKREEKVKMLVADSEKREQNKASALAKLAALGLTEDEIAAL